MLLLIICRVFSVVTLLLFCSCRRRGQPRQTQKEHCEGQKWWSSM